jgi:hypothetical protein
VSQVSAATTNANVCKLNVTTPIALIASVFVRLQGSTQMSALTLVTVTDNLTDDETYDIAGCDAHWMRMHYHEGVNAMYIFNMAHNPQCDGVDAMA